MICMECGKATSVLVDDKCNTCWQQQVLELKKKK